MLSSYFSKNPFDDFVEISCTIDQFHNTEKLKSSIFILEEKNLLSEEKIISLEEKIISLEEKIILLKNILEEKITLLENKKIFIKKSCKLNTKNRINLI